MPARSRFRIVAPERDSTRINERIRVAEIRVIGADGEQLGVMTPEEGRRQAGEAGLDLVEVAPNSRPPVCRIMDYGRYKYEQKKKHTGKNKQGHAATLKEVKLRPGTDTHDLEFKLGNARRFLMDGDKVKVTVMFRGREMVHRNRGRDQLDNVTRLLTGIAKVENPPRMEGRFLSMILVPDREGVVEAKKKDDALAALAAAAETEGEAPATQAAETPVETVEAVETAEAPKAETEDEAPKAQETEPLEDTAEAKGSEAST